MRILFHPRKRLSLSYATYLIRSTQDPSLPSCEKILAETITQSLLSLKSIENLTRKSAETLVYRIALDFVDSSRYRNPTGTLDSFGKQLLHICHNCLQYFLDVGYITQEEYDEHTDFLHCSDVEFEKYSVL